MAFDFSLIGTLKRDDGDDEKDAVLIILYRFINICLCTHLVKCVYVRDDVTSQNLSYITIKCY